MGATEGFGRALHRAQARSLLRNSSYFTVCVAVITGMLFYFLVGYCRCAEMLLISQGGLESGSLSFSLIDC